MEIKQSDIVRMALEKYLVERARTRKEESHNDQT
jgi:hypothetical protein